MEELTEQNNGNELEPKKERERQVLMEKVLSGNLEQMKDKVAFILNNSSQARNSDKELSWQYWKLFESDVLVGNSITKQQFYKLTKQSSIIRCRAKIQNEYRLFQADEEVKQYRGMLDEQYREDAISDKLDNVPVYSIYIDESGKTQEYLSVGSLWSPGGSSVYSAVKAILDWKEKENINYEFHFNKATKNKLDEYKQFFKLFLMHNPHVGFKTIIVSNKGIADRHQAITDLTYHVLFKGITHEHDSGRAPLPRLMQVYIDNEEKGSDLLKLENIKERIQAQKKEGLILGNFMALDSKKSIFIQAVDLFTASINRKLHNVGNKPNFKDELANYILDLLNFDMSSINTHSEIDKSEIFNLNYNQ